MVYLYTNDYNCAVQQKLTLYLSFSTNQFTVHLKPWRVLFQARHEFGKKITRQKPLTLHPHTFELLQVRQCQRRAHVCGLEEDAYRRNTFCISERDLLLHVGERFDNLCNHQQSLPLEYAVHYFRTDPFRSPKAWKCKLGSPNAFCAELERTCGCMLVYQLHIWYMGWQEGYWTYTVNQKK